MKEYAIMTLNLMTDHLILNGNVSFVKRASAITAMIKELHPDLIGVQELTRTMFPYLQEVFADYGIFGDSRHSLINDEYSSILYRRDRFDLIGGDTKWLSHTPDIQGSKVLRSVYPRIVTFGYLRDNEDQDIFTFANTHWDFALPAARNEQAEILAKILIERQKGSCTFVTGDFNTVIASDALHLFGKAHLKDTVSDELGSTLRGYFGSQSHQQHPIDHIYVSFDASILNVRKITMKYHHIYPSDHYPVIAYIAF
mgnify:CR=1 FL=1